MNKTLICISIVLFFYSACLTGQSTLYFVQTKVIVGGEARKGDMSNLFLSLTQKGCYDSDKQGMSVGNGFQKFVGENNGIINYHGDSYWGEVSYRLKADYSYLNIVDIKKKCIYIYERRDLSQANCVTSSKIKPQKNESQSKTDINIILNRHWGNDSEIIPPKERHETCRICNGSGQVKSIIPVTRVSTERCQECGEWMREGSCGHFHQMCTLCYGKGYVVSWD